MPVANEHSLSAGSARISAASLGDHPILGPVVRGEAPLPPVGPPPSNLLFIEATYNHAWTGDGVSFKAYNIGEDQYDDGFHGDFEWEFDDPGATYEHHGDAMLLPNDRNRALGPIAGHAWLTPGVKTVRCVQRTAGGQVEATFQVTVTEPTEAEFDRIYYISFAGNFAGAPPAGGKVSHISSADQLAAANKTRVWMRWRRGETFDVQRSDGLAGDRGVTIEHGSHRWDAWGEGARPLLTRSRNPSGGTTQYTMIRIWFNVSRFSICDIDFYGGYDPMRFPEGGVRGGWDTSLGRLHQLVFYLSDSSLRFSMWRCEVKGVGFAGDIRGDNANSYHGDVKITDWQDYGFGYFGPANSVMIDGGIIKQHPDVLSQDGKVGGDVNDPDHGCFRGHPPHKWIGMYGVDMRSRGGWTSGGGSGFRVEQPCIRLTHFPNSFNENNRCAVIGCILDGGYSAVTWGTTNGGEIVNSVGRCIFDMCDFIHTGTWTNFTFHVFFGGLTVRNCRVIVQNETAYLNEFRRLLLLENTFTGLPAEVYGAPINLYNNTLVTLKDGNQQMTFGLVDEFPGINITEWNNLLYGPFRDNAGDFPDWQPLDPVTFAPLAGSAAIGAATDAPLRDLSGEFRPVPASVGAQEVG